MCRLLAVQSKDLTPVNRYLRDFATVAKNSKEYQGHGWGCAYKVQDGFRFHKDIRPIWESDLPSLPATTMLIGHARSAFRNEGISIENNMPFADGDERTVFAFNGELRGVRIRERGRIGAEKVFRFAKRFAHLGWERALAKAADVIEKRSQYVRAMNVVLSDGAYVYAFSKFNEDPEYFTMYCRMDRGGLSVVCSEPLPMFPTAEWSALANGEVRRFP